MNRRKRRKLQRQCDRKRSYSTLDAANRAAKRSPGHPQYASGPMFGYQCAVCGEYHYGHRHKNKPRRRR